jgi:cellulose synthase/poly-beta-1,6-N-acetylglucosamine synthase-like glycosyltransferase
MWGAAEFVDLVLLPYVVGYYLVNLLMILVGVQEIRRQRKVAPSLLCESAAGSGALQPVTIVVPAFNEERSIHGTVASLLRLRYPVFEVVVVSDGSDDRTLAVLTEEYDLRPVSDYARQDLATQRIRGIRRSVRDPRLRVVDKRNGGKADALNAGINHANYPLVLIVDADVYVEPDALLHLALPFALEPATVATSGMIRPRNGCTVEDGVLVGTGLPPTLLEGFQVVEYLRAYGVGRLFFNRLNAQLLISGAFGLFSRRLLVDVGGYQPHAIGEDVELVVRIHRHLRHKNAPYRIAFSADALCLTEAPHSLRDLGRQRTRWHQGLLSTLRLHKGMAFRRRYGPVGTIAFPYFFFELIFPIVEALVWLVVPALLVVGAMGPAGVGRFIAIAVLAGMAVSLAAIAIDAASFAFFRRAVDRWRLVLLALLEPLGYRQCTMFYRLRTFVRYYRDIQLRSGWRSPARLAPSGSASGRAAE